MANGRVRTPRKEKQWNRLLSTQNALVADGTTIGSSIPFTSSQTVIRMIGEYFITPTSTITGGDTAKICVVLGKVSTDAFILGATAMPDPAGEPDYPWLYWAEHIVRYVVSGAPVSGNQIGGSHRQSFDIRTMRKFKSRESLAWVIQYVDITGTPPIALDIAQTRVLLTIH